MARYKSVLAMVMALSGPGRFVRQFKRGKIRRWFAKQSGVTFEYGDEESVTQAVREGRRVIRES